MTIIINIEVNFISRFLLVCGALSCTIYVAIRDYEQWQDNPVVTTLKVYVTKHSKGILILFIFNPGYK